MDNSALSPKAIQALQVVTGITTAVFIGGRFLPESVRQIVGRAVTICYLASFVALGLYILYR
jgi:hypothetical protein